MFLHSAPMAFSRNGQIGRPHPQLHSVQLGTQPDAARSSARGFRRNDRAPGQDIVVVASADERQLYFLTWFAIAFLTIVLHIVVSDEIVFADAVQYLTYTDNLYFYRSGDWFIFEPFSKIMLLLLRASTGSTETTVGYAHYVISFVYLFGTLAIFRPSEANWRGLIMAFALYGSQLAFVTIRATPAYIIASVAVMQAIRGQNRAFLFTGLAIFFHISAVLALIPILALFFKSKLTWLNFLQKPRALIITFILVGGIFVAAGSAIFSATSSILNSVPFLGKYLVFAVGMSDAGGVASITSRFAVGHFVLLVAITIFLVAFLLLNDQRTRSVSIFLIVSYAFYVFTFFAFSPIAAFRQTPFWVLPAFSIFPWHKVGWRSIGHFVFLAVAGGMFAFQFSRVI
jgi:hypothetical protein